MYKREYILPSTGGIWLAHVNLKGNTETFQVSEVYKFALKSKGKHVICPFCAHQESKVVDKREGADGKTTRRRRECLKCARRFTTFERAETLDLLVIKKDGKREVFDRVKLRSGIIKACEKRPISAQEVEKILDEVEADLRKKNVNEVSSKKIGELVIRRLKKIDEIAYIRFASVYRQFADLSDFEKELAMLSKRFKSK